MGLHEPRKARAAVLGRPQRRVLECHSNDDGAFTPHSTAGHQSETPSLSQEELSMEEFMNPKSDWLENGKENGRKQERKIIKMKNEQDL